MFYVFLFFFNFCFFVLIKNYDLNFIVKYGDCYIEEKNDSFVGVYNGGICFIVYFCWLVVNGRNKVYVFSNFGNSVSNEMIVEIFGDFFDFVFVVLLNYYKVYWRVIVWGMLVLNIYLVSLCFKDKFKVYMLVNLFIL